MFLGSDKNLRKGVVIKKGFSGKNKTSEQSSVGSSSSTSVPNSTAYSASSSISNSQGNTSVTTPLNDVDDIITKAKQDRDNRQQLRHLQIQATLIQSFWRGRYKHYQYIKLLRLRFDTKIAEISKLHSLLREKGLIFVPPIQSCVEVSGYLLYRLYYDSNDIARLSTLCEIVLIPSLGCQDISNNIISMFAAKLPFCLIAVEALFRGMLFKVTNIRKDLLCQCLSLLVGVKSAFVDANMKEYRVIQHFMWDKNILDLLKKQLLPITDCMIDQPSYTDNNKSYMLDIQSASECFLSLAMFLVDKWSSNQDGVRRFTTDLLTIPLLLSIAPSSSSIKLINWLHFKPLLLHISSNALSLPLSHRMPLESGHFLFGSIASLCSHILSEMCQVSDDVLLLYLSLCNTLMINFGVPSIFQGKDAVIWHRDGINLVCIGIPARVASQMMQLYNTNFTKQLLDRVFCTLHIDDMDAIATKLDLDEIKKAIDSTSIFMAQETMIDQQASSTWFTSKWASKLGSSFFKSIGNTLFFSSSKSSSQPTVPESIRKEPLTHSKLIVSTTTLWAKLYSLATLSPVNSIPWQSLCHLAFSTDSIKLLWLALLKQSNDLDDSCFSAEDEYACVGNYSIVACIVSILPTILVVSEDSELYEQNKPLPIHQIMRLLRLLKTTLYRNVKRDPSLFVELKAKECSNHELIKSTSRYAIYHAMSSILTDMYLRSSRKPFCTHSLWEVEEINTAAMRKELRDQTPFAVTVYTKMPFIISFYERMKIFKEIVDSEKALIQGVANPMGPNDFRSRGTMVRIRRSMLVQDGITAFKRIGLQIKDRVMVKYLNEFGEEEMGIDAGGLFKDFLTDISSRIFDPSYGLFMVTLTQSLYPNPAAQLLYGKDEMEELYDFLGKVLGKAIFEGITLQPQFAHFFLSFMHGKYNYKNLINDLSTFDRDLYKNLMFLKTYSGDISDLCLTFSVNDESMGAITEVDLIPNGRHVPVTAENKYRYINATAKYYLHDRIKLQSKAFFNGIYQVIHPDLLGIFCAPELQVLVSGASSGVSVSDMRSNTRYAGGYTTIDRNIRNFWSIVDELDKHDLGRLLKFVTSCERAPSLGFAALTPPFTIQRVDCSDDCRLPTASTCFNILKLPTYSSKNVLKEKLLTSIRSNAGFDLS